MKAPIPPDDDPTRDQFMKKLLKHDINIDEYCSIYESSAIPPNNNFSKLTLEIFAHSACFINEYSKYQSQLNIVIRKHIENYVVQEVEPGNFLIQNADTFTRLFHHIENLVVDVTSNQVNGIRQSLNTINQANRPTIQCRHTTVPIVNIFHDTIEKVQETHRDSPIKTLSNRQDTDIIEAFTDEEDDLLDDIHNSSMTTCEKVANDRDEHSDISTQKTLTDRENFWIEPTRAKKQTKKDSKRILRPGWLKSCPASNSNVLKFDFMQSLQKHANVTYDDFLKSFYPHQKENIFTNNNWTLSDELIEIFQSNIFYKEHVRYNIQRFRPSDVMTNELYAENQLQTSMKTT
ncbi:unnamed protein product [Rotaria socialis]|uniref:Uncharacterized protein n=1 Tax=Rotaria socialis TaxID=392032 RepID=A0A817R7B2_9BILA|nr:unnamed protein product [Rotaria socialis]CAF4124380.1 unnamed protein product [Rotaria socialis]